jgi:ribonuclease P protein component
MLHKRYRLKKRKQFNYIYRRGRSAHSEFLTLVYCGAKLRDIKVGFSASKKVGNSVLRHRAVRLMREAVKPYIPRMAPNNNYIFVAKEGITAKHLDEIKKCVEKVLTRGGLLV